MKNYLRISSVLGLIAAVCALLISGMYLLTSKTIKANEAALELKTCQAIFSSYDDNMKEEIEVDSDKIIKKVLAKDSSGSELGYLYTVSGANSYGGITLMVAIDMEGKVLQVEFLSNGQSFAGTVEEHVKKNYPSSSDDVIYIGIKPEAIEPVGSLTYDDVQKIDTVCGATFGADLVKELVNAALNDANGGN
jgi:hypothetical protein